MNTRIHRALAAALLVACGPTAEEGEELSGGGITVFDDSRDAYSRPPRDLDAEARRRFFVGNSFFTDAWVTAPSSVESRDGLGPVFNATACASCHARDGRGRPPEGTAEMVSMLVRISVPGVAADGGPLDVPGYGGQLQPRGIDGVPGEATTEVDWETIEGRYDDGEPYELRRPRLRIVQTAFGPLPSAMHTSMRVAPAVFGLGLLECVPEETILAAEDPSDADGDGISGRANRVFDVQSGRRDALGRFGWKANQPNLAQQNRGAFLGDMGLTSAFFPNENCVDGQDACRAARTGGAPEISDEIASLVDHYVALLAPPARRDVDDPAVLRGRDLFAAIGCADCHRSRLPTEGCALRPELEHQTLRPFTDLLLHDMGEGLADDRPDFAADGREWRTAPLWGIGLLPRVNDHELLLHDGRARGFAEAILWHGGEGEASRDAFRALDAASRDALIAFLRSL